MIIAMALLSEKLEETDQSRCELVATVNEVACDLSRRIFHLRSQQHQKVKSKSEQAGALAMSGDCESKVCDILKISADELGKIMTLKDEGMS